MSSFTTEQISALEKAIAEGTLEVTYGDKRVKYRSLDEMIRTLSLMRQSLAGTSLATRRTVGEAVKGL